MPETPVSLRVVLDANVLASALIRPDGSPGKVLGEILFGPGFDLVLSDAILKEYEHCLFKLKVRSRIPGTDDGVRDTLRAIAALGDRTEAPGGVIEGLRDPDDAIYIHAARHGAASVIVSGDKDLTDLHEVDGVKIMTPGEFLRMIAE